MKANNNNQAYTTEQIVSVINSDPKALESFQPLIPCIGGCSIGESILNDKSPKPYLDLIKIVCEYLNPFYYPFIKGEMRVEMLKERIQKFYIKYVDEI